MAFGVLAHPARDLDGGRALAQRIVRISAHHEQLCARPAREQTTQRERVRRMVGAVEADDDRALHTVVVSSPRRFNRAMTMRRSLTI